MTPEFNQWWDETDLTQTNPYDVGTPIFWAWEGYQAGVKANGKTLEVDVGASFADEIRARNK